MVSCAGILLQFPECSKRTNTVFFSFQRRFRAEGFREVSSFSLANLLSFAMELCPLRAGCEWSKGAARKAPSGRLQLCRSKVWRDLLLFQSKRHDRLYALHKAIPLKNKLNSWPQPAVTRRRAKHGQWLAVLWLTVGKAT